MRIILTANYSPWSAYCGGGQRSTHNLAKTFAERGHDVTAIFTKSPFEKISVPPDLSYNIQWAYLYNTHSKRNDFFRPLSSFAVARVAKKLLSDEKYTIIHSNGEEGGCINSLFGKKKIGFISSPRYSAYPERLAASDQMSLTDWVHLCLYDGKHLMQAKAIKHAHYCSPPSRWAADKIQEILKINPDKMKPIPNGVPSEFLNYTRTEKAKEGPIIFFGRFAYDKGVDLLISALINIDKDLLPPIHIIGRGDLEADLRKMVAQSPIADKVSFFPWMDHDKLGEKLSNARMAVLPSREENFSLAILSLLCTGCPTISTSVGGTPEIITHKKTGLLVSPSNTDELSSAILFFLKNVHKREEIGQKGANYVKNNLTWNETCKMFEKLYMKALSNPA